jgi:hypothetical protein
MKAAALFVAACLSGCANLDLKSAKESPVVYEAEARGNHAKMAGCIADELQGHEKYAVRNQRYAVRNYADRSEIQAHQESIYGGNLYLFTVELQQKTPQTVLVALRRLDVFKEYVATAIQSCSERL